MNKREVARRLAEQRRAAEAFEALGRIFTQHPELQQVVTQRWADGIGVSLAEMTRDTDRSRT